MVWSWLRQLRRGPQGGLSSSRRELLQVLPKGGACAEIGVWKGDFAAHILSETAPSRLHLVDPWAFAPHYPKRRYGGRQAGGQAAMDGIAKEVADRFAGNPQVEIHRVQSTDFFAGMPPGSLDWVYIDGDHSTKAVLSDLQGSWSAVRSGGWIVGDDYGWRDADGTHAVKEAIEQFSRERAVPFELIGGQFVIRR